MKTNEIRQKFLDYFASQGPHARAVQPARAGQRSDAAVHQRGHGAVQGRLPRRRQAPVQPGRRRRSAACAPAASTTTSRTSATPRATTRSSRCWATSASATTSSATRSASRGSCSPIELRPAEGQALDHGLRDRRRGLRLWTQRRSACRPSAASASATSPAGASSRATTSGRWPTPAPAARARRSSTTTGPAVAGGPPGSPGRRRRPLHRDLEPRVHAVQPRRGGHDASRCPSPPSTPAWASSASPRCCSTCTPTTRSTSSRR